MKEFHEPILVDEFLSFFEGRQIFTFLDATIGTAGHSLALLESHSEIKTLVALDQDQNSLEIAGKRLAHFEDRVKLIKGDFRDIDRLVENMTFDGIFFDVGISSVQLDAKERGFSFSSDAPLDMRKDLNQKTTAATLINRLTEKKLADLFWQYGEEPRSRRAAKAICEARRKKRITHTDELIKILGPVLTWRGRKNKHIHPMTLVFQALRIAVNDELNSLKEALPKACDRLNPQGRIGVISFHSLEDRIVKEVFREKSRQKELQILTKKPIVPTNEEINQNPRSRSSKMRFAQKEERV